MTGNLESKLGFWQAVPEWVIEKIPEIGDSAFTIYVYLVYRTHRKRGVAWPSYEAMKRDLGFGYNKISRALKILEKADMLERKRRFSNSTLYTLKEPENTSVSQSYQNGGNGEKSQSITTKTEVPLLSESIDYPDLINQTDLSTLKDSAETKHRERLISIFENLGGKVSADWLILSNGFTDAFQFEHVVDVGHFPEDVRPFIEMLCELWAIEPPKSKSSAFGWWIKSARELGEACAEFEHDLIYVVYADIENKNNPVTISRPASLIEFCRAAAGDLRKKGIKPADLKNEKTPSKRRITDKDGKELWSE